MFDASNVKLVGPNYKINSIGRGLGSKNTRLKKIALPITAKAKQATTQMQSTSEEVVMTAKKTKHQQILEFVRQAILGGT
jgi:hypothetical protein